MTELVPTQPIKKQRFKSDKEKLAEAEGMLRDRGLGLTQVELMNKYQVSRATLHRRLDYAIAHVLPTSVEAYRAQQNDLIDLAMSRLGHSLQQSDLMAEIAAEGRNFRMLEIVITKRLEILRVMALYLERRAKLNGLDAPTRLEGEVHHVHTEVDQETADLIRAAKERVRGRVS
jgi:hypothetical protein